MKLIILKAEFLDKQQAENTSLQNKHNVEKQDIEAKYQAEIVKI